MKVNTFFVFIGMLLALVGCRTKQVADMLVKNGHVFVIDSLITEHEAMVIGGGKVLATGDERSLLKSFQVDSVIDVKGAYIYPGFNDAHCHLFGLGQFMRMVDLGGTRNFDEVVDRCIHFYSKQTQNFILGRGWDQNQWPNQAYPDNAALNHAFPDIPVLLKRVDGHAAIANDYALQLAGINGRTKVPGGEVIIRNGQPSGVLIDNAVDLVEKIMPRPNRKENSAALMLAEQICFANGITAVTDAGLETEIIELIDSLHLTGNMQINVNAMISASPTNLDIWLKQGPFTSDRLRVASFKLYGDGALGSRGACLIHPYSDLPNHYGFLLSNPHELEEVVSKVAHSKFQLCTHAIGDSANRFMLKLYGKYLSPANERRWRIEHAQVVSQEDINLFGLYQIIPSVQPTHATSDMVWAADRLGSNRIQTAYSYANLQKQLGWIPLGTDFPVEQVSPLLTFYAAVSRTNLQGEPKGGFLPEQSLSKESALRGITTWPAKASFQENEMGSLLPGTSADFVVLDQNLLKLDLKQIPQINILETYVKGIRVYYNEQKIKR